MYFLFYHEVILQDIFQKYSKKIYILLHKFRINDMKDTLFLKIFLNKNNTLVANKIWSLNKQFVEQIIIIKVLFEEIV